MNFPDAIRKASETNRSRIVLALDIEGPSPQQIAGKSEAVLRKVSPHICAVKINRPLVLSLGLRNGVASLLELAHELSLPAIMDAKLNDVGHMNQSIAKQYFDAGFDAIIASPVVGWKDGLDAVFGLANSHGKSIILLVYMSNPGAEYLYSLNTAGSSNEPESVFEAFTRMAVEWRAHGVVVGATRPGVIARVRDLVGRQISIFSPGVGAQGGDAKASIKAGSDYLIVGRMICQADDPVAVAKRLGDLTQ